MLVACYTRVSTSEQSEHGYSLDEQRSRLEAYCAAMSWTVYKTYTDGGFSGGNTQRPALQAMIRDIEQHRVARVVVWKLDRLSRSQLDTLFLIEKVFLANGCDFVSMSENFDTSSPFGRAMLGILAVFAQLEREQIKERLYLGRQAQAKDGKFGAGRIPIGYKEKDDGRLVVDEYESMLIRRIYDEFLAGKAIHRIEKDLNAAGLTHKYGAWNNKTIQNILRRQTYIGMIPFSGNYYPGEHQPIITPEQFAQAQKLLVQRGVEHDVNNRRLGKATSYLGGYLICAHCGAKYCRLTSYKKGRTPISYYSCASRQKRTPSMIRDPNCTNKNYRMAELDELVFSEIKKLATDPAKTAEPVAKNGSEYGGKEIKKEIEKIDVQIERLLALYSLDEVPLDALQARLSALTKRKDALTAATQRDPEKQLTREETARIASSFADLLDTGSFDEIRFAIGQLIDHITIDGESIEIHWNFT